MKVEGVQNTTNTRVCGAKRYERPQRSGTPHQTVVEPVNICPIYLLGSFRSDPWSKSLLDGLSPLCIHDVYCITVNGPEPMLAIPEHVVCVAELLQEVLGQRLEEGLVRT